MIQWRYALFLTYFYRLMKICLILNPEVPFKKRMGRGWGRKITSWGKGTLDAVKLNYQAFSKRKISIGIHLFLQWHFLKASLTLWTLGEKSYIWLLAFQRSMLVEGNSVPVLFHDLHAKLQVLHHFGSWLTLST